MFRFSVGYYWKFEESPTTLPTIAGEGVGVWGVLAIFLVRVKIFWSGITRGGFGISPGHNGIIEKLRPPHSIA